MEILECQSFKFNCPHHRIGVIEDGTNAIGFSADMFSIKNVFCYIWCSFLCFALTMLGKEGENFIGKYSNAISDCLKMGGCGASVSFGIENK